jgi:hypothetical protein
MTHGHKWTIGTVVLAVVVGWHVSAAAQAHDHLKCYRTEDAGEAVLPVDIESAAFGLDSGCTIEAKVREHCVPATAIVLGNARPDAADLAGDDLAADRLCYEIECPKRDLPAAQVTDRFGSRLVSIRRSKLVCLPAD